MIALLLHFSFVALISCDQFTVGATTEKGSTVYTVTNNGNAFFIGGKTDMKIYRYEMLPSIESPTYTYQTTHTQQIDVIAVSHNDYYLATGGRDYRIQVRLAKNNTLVCTLWHYNQVKAMKFDPTNQKILFSGSEDKIRKWNISTCELDAEVDSTESVISLSVNDLGTQVAYGTLYGDVGYVDSDLTTLIKTADAHLFSVTSTLYMNSQYYVTFGQESNLILWKNGVEIDQLKKIAPNVLSGCDFVAKARYNDTFRSISCGSDNNYKSSRRVYLFKITNTSITRFTDHGFSVTHTWVFTHHMDSTSLMFVLGQSNGLSYNFIYDDNSEQCSPHTGLVPTENICKLCWYFIEGCHFCDNSVSDCTTCMGGTYESGGDCPQCSSDCISCSSSTNCNQCSPGYEEIGSSGNCRTPSSTLNGCFELTNSGTKCQQVTRGHYLTGNTARYCNHSDTGCIQCSVSGTCTGCETGYYLDNSNNCRLCDNSISGCIACANSTDCIKCSVAFKYSGTDLHCSNCLNYCETCGQFYDTCLSCDNITKHRWLNGTSCQCSDGYYQNGTQAICGLCSSVLDYCYLCNTNTVCLQCLANYFLVTSGGITECQTCNRYCQTCSGTSNNCTACNELTYNRELSGSNCVCKSGYVSLSGSIPCYSCATLNDGCISCTNETYCDSCDTGYYLKNFNASYRLCTTCPYYCPDCSQSGATYVCNSCPATRHIDNGQCVCDSGYFDDNMTQLCELCSDIIPNCESCNDRRKCLDCSSGMYPDSSNRMCNPCRSTCLTCGPYFTTCTSCNESQNRVLIDGQCACQQFAYDDNGVCILCNTAITNCNSCENPYICTGCQDGYTLQEDLKGCINCAAEINGCQNCTSKTACTVCKDEFYLINDKCRCQNSQYTSDQNWGSCINYTIPGLSSSLGMQIEAYQHQNNSLDVFIRFRAKVLYILNQDIEDSITLFIDNQQCISSIISIDNNRITLQTNLTKTYEDAKIRVSFSKDVFYNEKLLSLDNSEWEIVRRRLYFYEDTDAQTFMSMKETMVYIFYIFKWVFFGFTIIGIGHLIFPFVLIIQLLPIFLMINMSLPHNLASILQSMLSFQVPSIVPLLQINSDFSVYFPPINYDYYFLRDYIVFGKIGDAVLIILINILTKFDQGILRMFPTGKIRRYLYEALVRKGYSVMSLCILSLQASLLLVCSVYINYCQWQVTGEVLNYCCCVFVFGFYLAYNFNHASNLMGSKQLRNIDNENCYYDLNYQEPGANKPVLIILISQIWLAGSLFLVGTMPYFIGSLIFLLMRFISQLKPVFYIGKIQFAMRILQNLLLLVIYVMMFIFYLGESYFYLTFEGANKMGLTVLIFIFLFMLFCLIQKIVFHLKLETGWMKSKKIANENDDVIFAQKIEDGEEEFPEANEVASDTSYKNRAFLNTNTKMNVNKKTDKRTQFNETNKSNVFGQTQNDSVVNAGPFNNSNMNNKSMGPQNNSYLHPNGEYNRNQGRQMGNNSHNPFKGNNKNQSLYGQTKNNVSIMDARSTEQYFKESKKQTFNNDPKVRIKSANTSKYAQNHLQLRYKAQQQTLGKPPEEYDDY